jgi:predicted RNase H-like HicB family nuclease
MRGCNHGSAGMKTLKFTYWKDGNYYLGFLNDYPDYATQGMSKEELVSNLKDLLVDLESGEVSYVRKVEDLVVAE